MEAQEASVVFRVVDTVVEPFSQPVLHLLTTSEQAHRHPQHPERQSCAARNEYRHRRRLLRSDGLGTSAGPEVSPGQTETGCAAGFYARGVWRFSEEKLNPSMNGHRTSNRLELTWPGWLPVLPRRQGTLGQNDRHSGISARAWEL